jgi:excisionase family DNA binding protein
MTELLTVRDVQDLLKVDRITVYRMLKDGRLTGVKIGAHWRFARPQLDALVTAPRTPAHPPLPAAGQVLPLHCMQLIQDVFAEVADVSVITTTPAGEPLTTLSRPSPFWELLQTSERGRQDSLATWRRIAGGGPRPDQFLTCQAELDYTGAPVIVEGMLVAVVIMGPFYAAPPDRREEVAGVDGLARIYHLDPGALRAALRQIPVLDARKRAQIPAWVQSLASTFAEMSRERAALVSRLRSIAAMTNLETAP